MAIEWTEVEPAAAEMFDVWTTGGDLAFAKEAWQHLEAAGLTNDDTPALATQACLRLLVLRRIYEGFCAVKWDEKCETPLTYFTNGLEIDRLALGLLAASAPPPVTWEGLDEFEMFSTALSVAVEALRPGVVECLRKAYQGNSGLYSRLSRTRANDEGEESEDFDLKGLNVDAYDYVRRGCLD